MRQKTEEDVWGERVGYFLLGFLLVLIILEIGARVSWVNYQQYNDGCDERYGVDGWKMIETSGEGGCRFYIGQCWKCVEK